MPENRKSFFDTNILVYGYAQDEGGKQKIASELIQKNWEEHLACTSFQVLQEFLVTVTSKIKTPISFKEATTICENLFTWEPVITNDHVLRKAFQLKERFKVHFWDAAILAQALVLDCDILYSEDFQDGFKVDDLSVMNPFRAR